MNPDLLAEMIDEELTAVVTFKLRCSTTGRDGIRRWATSHRCSFWTIGVWRNKMKTWQHDICSMEDEKQREAHSFTQSNLRRAIS